MECATVTYAANKFYKSPTVTLLSYNSEPASVIDNFHDSSVFLYVFVYTRNARRVSVAALNIQLMLHIK